MTTTRSPEAKARLAMALAEVEAHPERWNQRVWKCGSKACLLGTYVDLHPDVAFTVGEGAVASGYLYFMDRGAVGEYISDWGPVELGLTYVEFDILIRENNSMEQLREYVRMYIDDEPLYDGEDGDYDWGASDYD